MGAVPGRGMSLGKRYRLLGAGGLSAAILWGLAGLAALDDIDFFNPADFWDAGLHHEHIVVGLALIGTLLFLLFMVLSVRVGTDSSA